MFEDRIQFVIPTILFAGEELPVASYFLDVAAENRWAVLDQWTIDWFWHFPICVGRRRESPSAAVLRACDSLLLVLDGEYPKDWERLQEFFPSNRVFHDEWRHALQAMRKSAQDRDVCVWTAVEQPERSDRCHWVVRLRSKRHKME
jgi:hypothetical protein